ncbi:MAG: hypothetical protein ABI867_41060 [Kofleriaceae bacterium]
MYRDDLAATHARVEQLQRELSSASSQQTQDKQRIAALTAQLAAVQQAMARMGGAMQQYRYPPQYGYAYPSRSGTVLTLGILSIVVCTVMGPIAWAMGNEELRRIDCGQAPPEQRGSVSAGRICGIISSVMLMLSVFFILMLMVTVH